MNATTSPLARAIETMSVPGILVDHRLIAEGDELALLPTEMAAFAGSVLKVRRASGGARIVARTLLSRSDTHRAPFRNPPRGCRYGRKIVGSLAHDPKVAIAAMAAQREFQSIGVDIEPTEPLAPDLLDIVATAKERERIEDDPFRGRLLFSIKEAVYKAVYPLDRIFLDHHDVEVSLPDGTAMVRNGRLVRFRHCLAEHIVTLAFVPVPSPAA